MTGFNCQAVCHLPVIKQSVALLTPHPGQGNPLKITSGQNAWKTRLTATAYNSTAATATPYSLTSAARRSQTAFTYFLIESSFPDIISRLCFPESASGRSPQTIVIGFCRRSRTVSNKRRLRASPPRNTATANAPDRSHSRPPSAADGLCVHDTGRSG